WLADGRAYGLGALGPAYRASQSVRTLMNADDPARANVKLSLGIVNTASRRNLPPHAVDIAPVISTWLTGIVARDGHFQQRYPLVLLPEYAGIIADRDGPLAGQIGAIWRQSVEAVLLPGEAAVPFNLLAVTEPNGSPAIAPWIERYGLLPWLTRLLEVAVLPVWHLLVGHGIAVEAHAQNMVLTHRNGWPERLILRDFHDSIEYSPEFLREPAEEPPFFDLNPIFRDGAPNQYYWSDHLEALRELVMDTLFIYNLTDLSDLLALAFGLPEMEFWGRVQRCLEGYARRETPGARLAALGTQAPEILTESLMREKLLRTEGELHHAVPNILADLSFVAREVDYAAY
ncbi:rhizobactin siderophore biosynthesis protein RhsF, partial [Elstera litoralis]